MKNSHEKFMSRAIEIAQRGIDSDAGGPFGAVIVKDGKIVAEGWNQVTSTNDPTAHAEVIAIRKACEKLDSFQLDGCILYTSCEPCPMCLGAIYWARPEKMFYAGTRKDAAEAGFDDEFIYEEISSDIDERRIQAVNILRDGAREVFENWVNKSDKVEY